MKLIAGIIFVLGICWKSWPHLCMQRGPFKFSNPIPYNISCELLSMAFKFQHFCQHTYSDTRSKWSIATIKTKTSHMKEFKFQHFCQHIHVFRHQISVIHYHDRIKDIPHERILFNDKVTLLLIKKQIVNIIVMSILGLKLDCCSVLCQFKLHGSFGVFWHHFSHSSYLRDPPSFTP